MSIESRENFAGIVTNAAGAVAPNGALVAAENVVIRRPGAIGPRDGLTPPASMNGTEVWGYAHGTRDLMARYAAGNFTHHDVLTGAALAGPPQPMRRDILTSAVARGNLYLPGADGVWRLLSGSSTFEQTGLTLKHAIVSGTATPQGPLPIKKLTGTTLFSDTTFMDLPAGQGAVPAGTYWIAAHVHLAAIPPLLEPKAIISRGRGVGVAAAGYTLHIYNSQWRFVWWLGGTALSVTRPILPSDAGRTFVIVVGYTAGSATIWVNGVQGTVTAGAVPTPDATDIMTFGNDHQNGPQPLQSAVLLSVAYGTTAMTGALADQAFQDTHANGDLTMPAAAGTTLQWKLSTLPPSPVLGGQVAVLAGPAPALVAVDALYPGDTAPLDYPAKFWLPLGYHVGYRLVAVDEDPNGGITRRSIPGGTFEVKNPGPGAASSVRLIVLDNGADYDAVEIYRTLATPGDVQLNDEMQLVYRFSGGVTWTDEVPDGDRGATLYTSPSRGGILQQNERPPACACIALFKGSLFFGNTRGPGTLLFSYKYGGDLTGVASDGRLGFRTTSGTRSSATSLTGVTPVAGIVPGMLVDRNGQIPTGAYVVSVAGTTVTISQDANGSGAGTYTFYDAIQFPGDATRKRVVENPYVDTPGIQFTTITPPAGGFTHTVSYQTVSRAPVSPTALAYASNGASYSPPISLFGGAGTPYKQDAVPGMLFWSKPDEPEHVPPIYFAYVGDQKKAILGLVPTRDALFILKEDGVWRLTGVNASWRIDPYDPTLFCCLPNSVYPLQEQAYFLSNKGVIAFSDAGSEIVSLPLNDAVKPIVDRVYAQFRSTGLYELPGLVGSFAGVFERENEYTLMLGRGLPASVFNRNNKVWTTFKYFATTDEPSEIVSVFNAVNAGRVAYAHKTPSDAAARALWTLLSTDPPPVLFESLRGIDAQVLPPATTARYDGVAAVTVTAVGSGAAPGATIAPVVPMLKDDVVSDATGRFWRVTQTSLTGVLSLAPQSSLAGGYFAPTSGAGHAFRTLRCEVTPQDFVAPPPRPKRWRALSTAFACLTGPVVLRYAYNSAESPRAVDAWDEEEADAVRLLGIIDYPEGYAYAGLVPSAHARSWAMSGSIRWAMTHGVVRLEGIYVEAEAGQIGRQQKAL